MSKMDTIKRTQKTVNRYVNPLKLQLETPVANGDENFKLQLQREISLLEAVKKDIGTMLDILLPEDATQ